METFVRNNVKHTFILNDDELKITIEPSMFYVFEITITDKNDIFNDKSIIKNIKILHKALIDGFKIGFDVNVLTQQQENEYVIDVSLSSTYVNETLKLIIPKISRDMSNTQIIEYVDTKKRHLHEKINKTNKTVADLMKQITYQNEVLTKQSQVIEDNNSMIVKLLNDKIQCENTMEQLTLIVSSMQRELTSYVTKHPIFDAENIIHAGKFMSVMASAQNITIVMKNGVYWLDKNCCYPILHFNMDDLKHLSHLENITLINCDPKFLTAFVCTDTLKCINIQNMSSLTSIKRLCDFQKLTTITIKGFCDVHDFHKLVECPKLLSLSVPKDTHNLIFPVSRKFVIIKT